MSRRKIILLVILFTVIVIQFIRPTKNVSDTRREADIITAFNIPSNVATVLKTSCSDCHSNNTRYPWYANIQPAGWLLAKHVSDGKEDLNFDEFANYSKRRQVSKLKSIRNSIKDASMPLSSYTLLHSDARLSDENKSIIISWTSKMMDSLSGRRK